MKVLRVLAGNWRLLLAATIAAMIIHIWTTLAAVRETASPAYTALLDGLPVNRISYFEPVTPKTQRLPFMMPDIRYAVCPFDVSKQNVRLKAELPGPGWNLSLHAPNGDNFLFVPGTDERKIDVDFTLRAPGLVFEAKNIQQLSADQQAPSLNLEHTRGVAIFRAPVGALALRRQTDERLNSLKCYAVRRSRKPL